MSRDDSVSVLRYWLALLRHEEALAIRPRARRVRHEDTPTDAQVASPAAGQDYIKVPFAGAEGFLSDASGSVDRAVEGEVGAFFEDWLAGQYRRGPEEGRLEHLAFFPSLLLPRQELAGLLRFGVEITWRYEDGKRFAVPSYAERGRKQFPAPPSTLQIQAIKPEPDSLPFFVDGKLLRETLRVDSERMDEFFTNLKGASLEPQQVLAKLCALLQEQVRADGGSKQSDVAASAKRRSRHATAEKHSAAALLDELYQVTRERLLQCGGRCRAFDVAVVIDASRNRASFHVQRDLQAALALIQEDKLDEVHPLRSYLGGQVARGVRQPVLGRFSGGLTESQRRAGELFLGSRVCAVQGPPGTGKTHLILSLAADELVRNMAALTQAEHPGEEFLLVTSTNNRAVDNVVQPLGRDLSSDQLPLALRVGSRDVIEKVTVGELERARRWLERRVEPTDQAWADAQQRFAVLHQRIGDQVAPGLAVQRNVERLRHAKDELAELLPRSKAVVLTEQQAKVLTACSVDIERVTRSAGEASHQLAELVSRLRQLSDLAEPDKAAALVIVEQHFKLTNERHVQVLEQHLGVSLILGLPPKFSKRVKQRTRREAWESAAEEALCRVGDLKDAVDALAAHTLLRGRVDELKQEVARLELKQQQDELSPVAITDWQALEPDLQELFVAANQLRQCWARKHKAPLCAALQHAIETCKRTRSLRALLSSSKGPGTWLRRLYPVWGCTLLSLGNNYNPEVNQAARVIIDEAGQCHPAYAASAMLRAGSILVIGDTHQLEPVIDVTEQDEARVLRTLKWNSVPGYLAPFRMYEGGHNSAQSVADQAVLERPTLIDHFRCQPEIAAVSELLCGYGLRTHTQPSSCASIVAELNFPLLHVPIEGEQERFAGSWLNRAEIDQVQLWVERLLGSGLEPSELGIISPFRGQVETLWRQLRSARIPLERSTGGDEDEQRSLFGSTGGGVALGTVHRFQGGERRVILFTTTITRVASLRFVDERVNLINVAASRAREHLVTFGHMSTLRAGTNTRILLDQSRALNELVNSSCISERA